MEEPPAQLVLRPRLVPDHVEGLALLLEGALHQVVVVGGDDHLAVSPPAPQRALGPGKEAVNVGDLDVVVEDLAEPGGSGSRSRASTTL